MWSGSWQFSAANIRWCDVILFGMPGIISDLASFGNENSPLFQGTLGYKMFFFV